MNGAQLTYDRVVYPGFPYYDTHPDRLAVMGILHGMHPAPVEHCRFLEIGCNEGSNLIPMAYAIPGAEFVGFDIAQLPVNRAQGKIKELGLSNIRVFQADILDAGEALGEFDYIIAHGIYSWVPEPVRDALLTLCSEHLAPNGIVYLSYNTLPGGHLRNMMREILLGRGRGAADPEQGVNEGLDFVHSILKLRDPADPLSGLLEREVKQLHRRDARQIFHDELSGEQCPVLFSTFMDHARKKGLRYLSESSTMPPGDPSFNPEALALAKGLGGGDLVAEEQVLDYVRMRKYRETLLCHEGALSAPGVCPDNLKQFKLASQAQSAPGSAPGLRQFTLSDGAQLEMGDPMFNAVLQFLIDAWPQAVSFSELEQHLAAQGIAADAELLELLLQCVSARMIHLHVWDAPISKGIAERPRASASGRQEAVTQDFVTTLHHQTLGLGDALVHRFLAMLDGSLDRDGLLQNVKREFPDMPEASIVAGIDMSLSMLYRAGLLVADDFA